LPQAMKLNQINRSQFQQKIKAFFHSKKWENLLVFFAFVVLASGFWILQYFRQKFEFEIAIPIHYTEIPSGIALSAKLPQQINLNVQDKGTVWLAYEVNKEKLSVDIELKDIRLDKSSYIIDKSFLYNLISERLSPSTQLKSFSPERIEIDYSPLAKKKLPVVIDGLLSLAPGYMFSDSIMIEPSFVTVYGDKETLDTLFAIQTIRMDKSNIDKKLDLSTQLSVPPGVQLSAVKVGLTADVEEYTEKLFELPVLCNNLPENRTVRFFPSSVELYVQVGLNKYAQVTESDFEMAVDYNSLVQKNAMNCTLKLTKKPQWLVNYRIVPETVEFLMEQKRD
jgi:YbbR domain-containing protein